MVRPRKGGGDGLTGYGEAEGSRTKRRVAGRASARVHPLDQLVIGDDDLVLLPLAHANIERGGLHGGTEGGRLCGHLVVDHRHLMGIQPNASAPLARLAPGRVQRTLEDFGELLQEVEVLHLNRLRTLVLKLRALQIDFHVRIRGPLCLPHAIVHLPPLVVNCRPHPLDRKAVLALLLERRAHEHRLVGRWHLAIVDAGNERHGLWRRVAGLLLGDREEEAGLPGLLKPTPQPSRPRFHTAGGAWAWGACEFVSCSSWCEYEDF